MGHRRSGPGVGVELLHKTVFRPPRPPFHYQSWMDELGRIELLRRTGKLVDGNALREAYEAGLDGNLDAVESFIGLYELGKD